MVEPGHPVFPRDTDRSRHHQQRQQSRLGARHADVQENRRRDAAPEQCPVRLSRVFSVRIQQQQQQHERTCRYSPVDITCPQS